MKVPMQSRAEGVVPDQIKGISPGRLLLFSYAFPPVQTQMTPAVVKPMVALARQGYEVDVLCAAPFSQFLGIDESLLPYAEKNFHNIMRLHPPKGFVGRFLLRSNTLSKSPDLMSVLHDAAFAMLMNMDLDQYQTIMTWSPFHSVNPVMVRLKKNRPRVRWIAQFSDPWARNPLENSWLRKIWNWWHEPRAVEAADFIIHSSGYSLKLMMEGRAAEIMNKTEVIPHPFDDALYPMRPKTKNKRITLRYIGMLFGRRSPEPLFQALNELFARRQDMKGGLHVELVGYVPHEMLETPAARSLPVDTVSHVPGVSYVESLAKMYDADILVLIEADVKKNLFVPSKLADYMGACTPIVGIAPPGGSEDILKGLKCWGAPPSDIKGIAGALEAAVDYVASCSKDPWCDEEYRLTFSSSQIVRRFSKIVEMVKQV